MDSKKLKGLSIDGFQPNRVLKKASALFIRRPFAIDLWHLKLFPPCSLEKAKGKVQTAKMTETRHRVVIIDGGFGGLSAARALKRASGGHSARPLQLPSSSALAL
jgi:hypothetical protein